MNGALPTSSDAMIERGEEPHLLCIDDEQSTEVLKALSSETSQKIFRLLNQEPMAAQDIANRVDMSLQAVSYHLDNLKDAGLITVLDTCYSEKGMEMDVYGPPEEPLLLFMGPSDDRPGIIASFKRFAGVVGPVAILIVIAETILRILNTDS